ncbi:MAG TPA: dehydrogenase [Clostridiales bacterium]|nr:dehydrogenase [Clostridiales bacterium]
MAKRVPAAELVDLCQRVAEANGVPPEAARELAEALVAADRWGISSHGVRNLPVYVDRLRRGGLDPAARPEVLVSRGALTLLDGRAGLGQVAAAEACRLAAEKARQLGIGITVVVNTSHAGALGYWTWRVTLEGLIGMMVSNANPTVAPYGSRAAGLGTNPISLAFPSDGTPVVVDLATSATAKGKIYELADRQESLPEGLALDETGNPTRDPQAALKGVLLPLGGAKGSALSVAVELLTGVLTGGGFGPAVRSLHREPSEPQRISFTFGALDPDLLVPGYRRRVTEFCEHIRNLDPAPGVVRIHLPGERELERSREAETLGVPVAKDVLEELEELARKDRPGTVKESRR